MERDTLIGVTLLVGVVTIAEAFEVVMHRVGKFALMPGEVGRIARNTPLDWPLRSLCRFCRSWSRRGRR